MCKLSLISVFLNLSILKSGISPARLNSYAFLCTLAFHIGCRSLLDAVHRIFALVPQKALHQRILTSGRWFCNRRGLLSIVRMAGERQQWWVCNVKSLLWLVNIRASFPAWKVLEGIQTRVHFVALSAALPALLAKHGSGLVQWKCGRGKVGRWQGNVEKVGCRGRQIGFRFEHVLLKNVRPL